MDNVSISLILIITLFTVHIEAVTDEKRLQYVERNNCSNDSIVWYPELQESLLQRKANIDSLDQAFFPINQRTPVAVDVIVHFSTSLQKANQGLRNLSEARLDNATFDYKFRWSASAVLAFLRPELLEPLSLFVYQGYVTTAEVVIDPICGTPDIEDRKVNGKAICKHSTDGYPEQLLNRLTVHLKSYALNRDTKVSEGLRGFSSYYFNHAASTDLCVIHKSGEYILSRTFLIIAVILFCVLVAIGLPALLHSLDVANLVEREDNENGNQCLRDEQTNVGRRNPNGKKSMMNDQMVKTSKYYIWTIFGITPCLVVLGIVSVDLWFVIYKGFMGDSLRADINTNYIVILSTLIILPVLDAISVACLEKCLLDPKAANAEGQNTRSRCIRCVGIFFIVFALQLITFHSFFVLLAFISSPLQTVSVLLFYCSVFFSGVVFIATLLKVFHNIYQGKLHCTSRRLCRKSKCLLFIQLIVTIHFTLFVASFSSFFFVTTMLAGEYHFENGISGFVSALTPTATISLIGLVGNKLIGTLNSITHKSDDNLGTSTGHESNNNSEMPIDTAAISRGGGSSLFTPVGDTSREGSEEGFDQFSTTADISTRQSDE